MNRQKKFKSGLPTGIPTHSHTFLNAQCVDMRPRSSLGTWTTKKYISNFMVEIFQTSYTDLTLSLLKKNHRSEEIWCGQV